MIYVCVPVHNEASTVGLVLWKVRQVFTAFQREYQIIACDDASTDATGEVLASYARVLPLTVIKHRTRLGYARSLEELLRLALQRTDRPGPVPGNSCSAPGARVASSAPRAKARRRCSCWRCSRRPRRSSRRTPYARAKS